MIYPTIHLNGTSRDELQRQLREAHEAIEAALKAMANATPHGRDYYVQSNNAINVAMTEHQYRMKRLEDVKDELFDIWEHIA